MQGLYSILDRKAVAFGAPMFFANDDMAKRGCADTMRAGGDYAYVHYPDDFDVYRVGTFDTDSGVIIPQVPAVLVCRFSDFVGA